MSLFLPTTATSAAEWVRKTATAVNGILARQGTPFQAFDAEPDSPVLGQTYFDRTLLKVRTWDGTAWNDHW